jgi:hypothetical protein
VSFRRHLVKWENEFAKCGLVFVEISGGKEAEFDISQRRLSKWGVGHSVLWDKDNKNIKAYEIKTWPTAFLIDVDGKVFWQGNPATLNGRKDDEAAFRSALKQQVEKLKRTEK